jgi:DNA-binding NarL/FixJ family response regulator
MSNLIRVVIVDDHPLFRDGVARTLNSDPNMKSSLREEILRMQYPCLKV